MQGTTGTSQIDAAIERMLAESRFTLQERPGVVASSISRERLPLHEGPTVYIPKYGTVTTYALTEGVDMAQAQQITDTVMNLSPAEHGAQVVLTDMMLMTVRDEFFAVAGRILADSFDRQREQTLCDDFDNYSTALGSAGTSLAIGHVMAAHAAIKYGSPAAGAGRGGEPGPDPVYAVLTPAQIHSLKKTMSVQVPTYTNYQWVDGTTGARNEFLANPAAANYQSDFDAAGVRVRQSVNINKDASDDAKSGVFSQQAQILVELGDAPSAERERDASLRAWEINFVGRWARGEYADGWGREMLFDSAAPTS